MADYVAGALRPAFAVVVAAHVEGCVHCRGAVEALEALGGAMVEDLGAETLADDALDRAMAAIERPLDAAPAPTPKPAADRIPFGREMWIGPGMGIRKARIDDGGDLLYLLRLPAGLQTIPHGHQGLEFTAVLKGAFEDDSGRFAAGDFAEMTDEIDHQPSVTPDSECICLIASERPMKVRTLIGRFVHLMTGV
jgi:putative transcriptional regulator